MRSIWDAIIAWFSERNQGTTLRKEDVLAVIPQGTWVNLFGEDSVHSSLVAAHGFVSDAQVHVYLKQLVAEGAIAEVTALKTVRSVSGDVSTKTVPKYSRVDSSGHRSEYGLHPVSSVEITQ